MESQELIDRYAGLCDAADRRANDGWRSIDEDDQKRRFAITPEVLDRFADYLFGGIGFEVHRDFLGSLPSLTGQIGRRPELTPETRAAHATAVSQLLQRTTTLFAAKGVPSEDWLPLIAADNVVGGLLMKVRVADRMVVVSSHTLAVAPRAVLFRAAMGSLPASVLEIGGGHGRFVRDVLMLSPATRITYCDLPLNLLFAARYLSLVFPGDVHLAWDDGPIPASSRITLVPPWRLTEVPYRIDACCNFLSFQHMHAENLDYYGVALQALSVPAIYHINRSTAFQPQEIPLAAYPFRAAYRTVFGRVPGRGVAGGWSPRSPAGCRAAVSRRVPAG